MFNIASMINLVQLFWSWTTWNWRSCSVERIWCC